MRRTAKLLLLGALAGVATGGAVAAAVPEGTPARTEAHADPEVAPVVSDVRRVAAMRPVPDGGWTRLHARGPVRVAVRAPDPRGGPDWAVRQFLADRLAPSGTGGTRAGRVIGRSRCVQLGRVHDGRFGWLEGDGTFRPVGVRLVGAPTECLSRRPDLGGRPFGDVVTTITDPERPAAAPVQTVVWGLAGSATSDARLTAAGRQRPVGLGAAGALLAVLEPSVRRGDVRLTVRVAGRERQVLPTTDALGPPPGLPGPAPGGVPQLAAQAPDPDGGLPHGMIAVRATDGGVCTGSGGRVVGDRAGRVDFTLDLLAGQIGVNTCSPAPRMTGAAAERRPYSMSSSYTGGLGVEEGEDPAAGRIARRTLPGRLVLSGIAAPEVRHLTFAGPSDTRTISPSGPAHAFLVVYAGLPPAGELTITTTFRDGSTRRDTMPSGF